MMAGILAALGIVGNLAGQVITHRTEKAEAKHKAELKRMENEASWEAEQARASGKSWKDEYLTIVITIPIWLNLYHSGGDVDVFFTSMDKAPDWWWWSFMAIVSASFGLRFTNQIFGKDKK